MRVLVLGSGGREHAICAAISKSNNLEELLVAPGNAGISEIAICVKLDIEDNQAVLEFCQDNKIHLVIVGPEAPLVNGVVDLLEANGIMAFGPSKSASRLEGSKIFMKESAAKYKIPTAKFGSFDDYSRAKLFIEDLAYPVVIKTDGLAAGKGVIIANTKKEAQIAVEEMFAGKFGNAGRKIVVEEFLEGEEISYFVLSDGKDYIAFGSAQDHKRIGEGDTGLNTGGMGAYTPAPVLTPEIEKKILQNLIEPLLVGFKQDGHPYKGFLFAGVMVANGEPKLLEYNVRLGDPEAEVILPLLENDFLDIAVKTCKGQLGYVVPKFQNKTAITVVISAKGYPGNYAKNLPIKLPIELDQDVAIYHSGTMLDANGDLVSNGGRVLNIMAMADNIIEAREKAYAQIAKIDFPDGYFRRDIGHRALGKL